MRNSWVALLEHQFARRLARALTEGERGTLRLRLKSLGAARLGDVVLDLRAEELAGWIADPDALSWWAGLARSVKHERPIP